MYQEVGVLTKGSPFNISLVMGLVPCVCFYVYHLANYLVTLFLMLQQALQVVCLLNQNGCHFYYLSFLPLMKEVLALNGRLSPLVGKRYGRYTGDV